MNVVPSVRMLFSNLPFPIPPNLKILLSSDITFLDYFEDHCTQPLSHVWLFVTSWAVAHQALLWACSSLSKNTGVCCHALLQGILPTQGLDPGLPYCRQFLFCLSHQGGTDSLWVCTYLCGYSTCPPAGMYTQRGHYFCLVCSGLCLLGLMEELVHSRCTVSTCQVSERRAPSLVPWRALHERLPDCLPPTTTLYIYGVISNGKVPHNSN